MRRKPIPTYPKVLELYVPFWKTCKKCGYEFKSEVGYKIEDTFSNDRIVVQYLCGECAPNIEEARRIAVEEKYQPKPECTPPSQCLD